MFNLFNNLNQFTTLYKVVKLIYPHPLHKYYVIRCIIKIKKQNPFLLYE